MTNPLGQKVHYRPGELTLIGRCWSTYTAYYLGRVNISPAFPLLASALSLSLGEVGWLGTVFFWAYGVGQLVHGQLGNIIRPRWMVLFGLVVIAATNLLFAAQDTLVPMLALWATNGFAQAAGWGPMLRILNTRFDERQRRHLATPFAMSFQAGTAASWGDITSLAGTGRRMARVILAAGHPVSPGRVCLVAQRSGRAAKPLLHPKRQFTMGRNRP